MTVTSRHSTATSSRGTSGAMKFDNQQSAKLTMMFSQMYTETYSPVREYISNGVRATRIAGTNKPVEVEISTADRYAVRSVITITDHGTGMSADEMKNIFLWAGRSNTNTNDDSAGGFGIGAKSGLSLTDSFTVNTVKDGQETEVVLTKNEYIEYEFTKCGNTDKDNGTIVTLVVSGKQAYNVLHGLKEHVIPFYPESELTVIVDGQTITNPLSDVHWVKDVAFAHSRTVSPHAVVDGVAYQIPFTINYDVEYDELRLFPVIVNCDNNEVTIPTSREGLESSKLSIETVTNKVNAAFKQLVSDILEASTSFTTAHQLRDSVVCSMWKNMRNTTFITDNKDGINLSLHTPACSSSIIVGIEGTPAEKQRLPIHGVAMKRWKEEKGEEEYNRVLDLMRGRDTYHDYKNIDEFLDSPIVSLSQYNIGTLNTKITKNLEETFAREHITVRDLLEAFEIDYITSPELKEVKCEVNRVSSAVLRREKAANKVNSGSYRATLHDAWCKVYYKGKTYNLEDIDDPSIFDGALTCVVSSTHYMDNDFLKAYVDCGYIVYVCRYRTTMTSIVKKLGMDKKDVVKEKDFRFDKMIEKGMPKWVISPKTVELVNEVNSAIAIKPGYQLVDDILSGSDDVSHAVVDGFWPDDNKVLNVLRIHVKNNALKGTTYVGVPHQFYTHNWDTEEVYNNNVNMLKKNIAAMPLVLELEEKITNIMIGEHDA